MYRILVADDETMIREGLKCLLDYEALGFAICAEAADGESAYEAILHSRPDVVLMDIRMPQMSGLEVIRRTREQGYNGKVVIISSHTDFRYAQEAMGCGVQHYLTKPIDEDELQQILTDFKTEMDAAKAAAEMERYYSRLARTSLIQGLLLGNTGSEQIDPMRSELAAPVYQVVICENLAGCGSETAEYVENLLHISDRHCRRVSLDGREVLVLMDIHAVSKFSEFLKSGCCGHWATTVSNGLQLAYGSCVENLTDIARSYSEAMEAVHQRFFCRPGQHVLGYDRLPRQAASLPILTEQMSKAYADSLVDYVLTFNRSRIANTLEDLQSQIIAAGDSVEDIKLFLAGLLLLVKSRLRHLHPNADLPLPGNAEIIGSVQECDFLYEIIRLFSGLFQNIMDTMGISNRDSILDDILHYINHNYAGNITLESIAPLFGYNSSYLGKIFSKKVGINFNAYVDQVRIEQAKKLLLEESSRVYTIAERVGYRNVDYFHIKFRKYVGQSPSEFRKKHKT